MSFFSNICGKIYPVEVLVGYNYQMQWKKGFLPRV